MGVWRSARRTFKAMDLFKTDVRVTWHNTDKETGTVGYTDEQGSWCGGLFSLVYMGCLVAVLLFKTMIVFSGQDDKYNQFRLTNDKIEDVNTVMNFTANNMLHLALFDPKDFKT